MLHGLHLAEQVCRTERADTMARIARSRGLLALPPETLLTPGTFDQVVAKPSRHELHSKFLVLCPKIEMRGDPLISLL